MNLAYKHLESKLKIGDFTIGQWFCAFVGVLLMLVWGIYISPFGSYLTIITAVYLGGVPIALALVTTYAEVNLLGMVRAAARWYRTDGVYAAGPGQNAIGYSVKPDAKTTRTARRDAELTTLDLDTLWDS